MRLNGNTRTAGLVALSICLLAGIAGRASSAVELVAWTIDGGGGTSQSGAITLSGATGQADAGGPLTGGSIELNGGFCAWVGLRPGDIDADLSVDVVDLLYMAGPWGTNLGDPGYLPACDLNLDGSIDVVDLLIMAENWNQ